MTEARSSHPLSSKFTFWFSQKQHGKKQQSYEDAIKNLGSFDTVEDFWSYYGFMKRAHDLPASSDIHFFKHGIKPMWEDDANKQGGKWLLRLRKGLASRYWENIVLAIIGNEYQVDDELCGAVLSIRHYEDIISLWNRHADDEDAKLKIKDMMRKVLQLPNSTVIEYKTHDSSLRDKSSFRNTKAFQ